MEYYKISIIGIQYDLCINWHTIVVSLVLLLSISSETTLPVLCRVDSDMTDIWYTELNFYGFPNLSDISPIKYIYIKSMSCTNLFGIFKGQPNSST